jgi:NadR type nicotinamide-nucleotide adenylyltransferase
MRGIKRIVAIGPESTGKSTLCQQLADHYQTKWCPEFAREYLLQNGMNYTYNDLLYIAQQQVKIEDDVARQMLDQQPNATSDLLLFVDTNLYVMKVWCEFVFGKCHEWILNCIAERPYHLYLLCNTELLWVKDELREYPDLSTREKLFQIYLDIMVNQTVPWVEIKADRLRTAIHAIDDLDRHKK